MSTTAAVYGIGAITPKTALVVVQSTVKEPLKQKLNKTFTENNRQVNGKYVSENSMASSQKKFKVSLYNKAKLLYVCLKRNLKQF